MARDYSMAFVSTDSDGVQYVNTLTVRSDDGLGGLTEAADTDVLNAFDTWLRAKYLDVLNPQYNLARITLRGILGHVAELEKLINAAGTLPTPGSPVALPRECTMVVKLTTGVPGRRHRGRMFMPSPRYSDLGASSTWDTATTAAYWTNVGHFFDQVLAGHDFTSGVGSYHLSGRIWSRKDAATHDLTGYLRRSPVHWLRSRSTAP